MDQQNQFSSPVQNDPVLQPKDTNSSNLSQNTFVENKPRKFGPIIVIAIVVLIIITTLIYLFSSKINTETIEQANTETVEQNNAQTTNSTPTINTEQNQAVQENIVPISNTDDDINSLQNDLNTSIDGIEMQSI